MTPYGSPPGAPQAPQTLEAFLAQRGPLTPAELSPLLGPVMDQLGTLHASGQHHGNVSADTITVAPTPDGNAVGWLPEATPLSAGALPLYQSPEQLAEGGQVGYWSDIYAIAAVVHRAVTGQPPLQGGTAEAVRQAHLGIAPANVTALRPDLPRELDGVLQQGLAKAPADRQASMQAFRQAVETAAQAAPPPSAAYAPAAPAPGMPPQAMAPAPSAPGYPPAAAPAHLAPQAPGPMPPTMLHPSHQAAPKSNSKQLIIVVAAVGMLTMTGGMVFALMAGSSDKQKSSSASSETVKPEPEKKRVPPTPPKRAAKAPVVADPALPGVDDKIKLAPSPAALPGGAGPHYRLDDTGRPWIGAPFAPVVIALFADLQCPWSKRVRKLIKSLLAKYPKDLKVVWYDYPLRMHKGALPAAIAARAVYEKKGNGAFWRFTDKVFSDYKNIAPDRLAAWAAEVGAGKGGIASALGEGRHKTAVQRDTTYGKSIGVRGTPTLFVNGIKLTGRRSVDTVSAMIDTELRKVKQAVTAGTTTRKGYYALLMKSGRTSKPEGANVKPGSKRKRPKLDPKAIYRIPVFKDDVWRGAKRPLVTLVVWSDFECPYCRYLACSLEELMKRYRTTVRFIFRHHPLSSHKRAVPAAEAVETARALKGRKGFWRMYAKVFPTGQCPRTTSKLHIRQWRSKLRGSKTMLSNASLERYAKRLRLPMRRFRRAMKKRTHRRRIEAQAAAAKALGLRGTPAMFVNGRYVRGYRSYRKLKGIIDAELKKARFMIKRGVSRRQLYNRIISRGHRKLQYLP